VGGNNVERFHQSEHRAHGIEGNAIHARWHRFAVVALIASVVFAVGTISIFARGYFTSNNVRVSGVQIPIYLKSATNGAEITSDVAAVVGFDSVKNGHQRFGFLRIGFLPVVVLDQLRFEVVDVKRFGEALAQTNRRLLEYVKPGNALEGREFELRFPDGTEQLSAKVVHFAHDAWRLEDGVVTTANSTCAFRSATLQMSGANVGELACSTGSRIVRISFSSTVGKKIP
jgi:hypothetical protein